MSHQAVVRSKPIQQFQRNAGARQKCPKVLGGRIDFFELALDLKFAVFITVFPNIITVDTTVTGFAVGGYLALGDVHDLTAVVLTLVSKHNDGKRLTGL